MKLSIAISLFMTLFAFVQSIEVSVSSSKEDTHQQQQLLLHPSAHKIIFFCSALFLFRPQ
jgi:hypothetical protein